MSTRQRNSPLRQKSKSNERMAAAISSSNATLQAAREAQFMKSQMRNDQNNYSYYQNENMNDSRMGRSRSRSPMDQMKADNTRQYQYQSRFGMNTSYSANENLNSQYKKSSYSRTQISSKPPAKSSQHVEFFISELQQEINDLNNRKKDIGQLQDQYRYLQEQYKNVQIDIKRMENECQSKIAEDQTEASRLIRELDQVRYENVTVEKEQIKLLEQVQISEKEVAVLSGELAGLRQQSNINDQQNLNLRKEIEYQDNGLKEQKSISAAAYKELGRLRGVQMHLDKENEQHHKRNQILATEVENNNQRIQNNEDTVVKQEDDISRLQSKIGEASSCIQELKYNLNKLDGELGYFENQNSQHQNAQEQLFKGNEYEYVNSKENQLRMQELASDLQKLEQDQSTMGHELDRLKKHSNEMMRDQIDLQAEVDALDKHVSNLNNQNYCLQKELEGFITADDQVRTKLDHRQNAENIRSRVDDVIRRSQAEVDDSKNYGRSRSNNRSFERAQSSYANGSAQKQQNKAYASSYLQQREENRSYERQAAEKEFEARRSKNEYKMNEEQIDNRYLQKSTSKFGNQNGYNKYEDPEDQEHQEYYEENQRKGGTSAHYAPRDGPRQRVNLDKYKYQEEGQYRRDSYSPLRERSKEKKKGVSFM